MKRIFTLLLTFCVFLAALQIASLSVSAESATGTYHGFLKYRITDGEVTITDCETNIVDFVFPSEIEGYPVTAIGSQAFRQCISLESITIPDGVTSIGNNAFWQCINLKSITIPNSVTSFGISPFAECYRLKNISLGDSVTCLETSLDSHTMFNDTAYYKDESNWENGVLYIGKNLIKAKTNISGNCVIKDGTKNIVRLAFDGCTNLTSVTMPDSLTSIGWYAFNGCTGLTSINIPNSVTSMGHYTFYDCSNLSHIFIPSSVGVIGEFSFGGCDKLSDIYCEAETQPEGWRPYWDSDEYGKGDMIYNGTVRKIHWGYTYDDYMKYIVTAAGAKLENPFKDVKLDQYYAEPVLWAVGKNITNGMSANTFAPNNDCTRGQIVTFLWRAAGSPEPTTTKNPFVDVKSNQYYYKAVLWAVEKGITNGTSANTFSPDATCTRAQVVTFLWRAKGSPKVSASNPFKDVKKSYYSDAVLWAVKNNITTGISATQFAPDNTCTRGQIVTFLYRAYK